MRLHWAHRRIGQAALVAALVGVGLAPATFATTAVGAATGQLCPDPLPGYAPDTTLPTQSGLAPIFNSEPYTTQPATYTPQPTAIEDQLVALVNAVPPNAPTGLGSMWVAEDEMKDCNLANALAAAAVNRGNHVFVILDSGAADTSQPAYNTLYHYSSTNLPGSLLSLTICPSTGGNSEGCMSHLQGPMHNKLGVFFDVATTTGSSTSPVVFLTSENADTLTATGSGNAKWNNAIVDVSPPGDTTLWSSYHLYLSTLVSEAHAATAYPDYGDIFCGTSGHPSEPKCQDSATRLDTPQAAKAFYYPNDKSQDPDQVMLDNTGCSSTSNGGKPGTLYVVQDEWEGSRGVSLVDELQKLGAAGCNVNILVRFGSDTTAGLHSSVYDELNKSASNKLHLYYMCGPSSEKGTVPAYLRNNSFHSKYFVYLAGSNSEVYTGSENWTGVAQTASDQADMRIGNPSIANLYALNAGTLIGAKDGTIVPGQQTSEAGYTCPKARSNPPTNLQAVAGTVVSADVSGLTSGKHYTFTVHATNAQGNSPESYPSAAVAAP